MFSLCHPWFTTTNLSYTFPILETSATASCGSTGTITYFYHLLSTMDIPVDPPRTAKFQLPLIDRDRFLVVGKIAENFHTLTESRYLLFLVGPIWSYLWPIASMYGIFTYIWLFLMVQYGKGRWIFHTWMVRGGVDPQFHFVNCWRRVRFHARISLNQIP